MHECDGGGGGVGGLPASSLSHQLNVGVCGGEEPNIHVYHFMFCYCTIAV